MTAPASAPPDADDWPEPVEHPWAARPASFDRLPVLRNLDTPTLVARLRQAIWVVALLAAGMWVVLGANRPADPVLVDEFGTISINVMSPAGSVLPSALCAELADTQSARLQGLKGRTDLAGHVGMVFVFEEDATSPFHMQGVPIDLSIAWFAADGTFVSAADMTKCADGGFCPTYPPTGPYRYALEVESGRLGDLGIAPGAKLQLGERGCRPGA